LAALLLKLGGYGIWRVFRLVKSFIRLSLPTVIIIGLLGGVLVRFICFVQVDMKSLVAYSSVVHIGILLSGLGVGLLIGFDGSLMIMVGHGLVSSGLFFLVGCVYDRSGSRSLLINKGIVVVFPSLTIIWFLLSIFNIRAPPSLNLLREIFLTARVLSWGWKTFFYLIIINFMGMVFTFYLYAQSQQGKSFDGIIRSSSIFTREYRVGGGHVAFLLGMTLRFWAF
jgi:NADH-ubiquinone oxidoreductase chain 4